MAQVKFIQLGTTGNEIPWADYNGKVDNPKSLAKAKQDYPGAIIFATYINESGERAQAIHANGEEYSVGGGGGGTVYVGTKTVKNGTLDTSGKVYKDGFSGTEKLDTTFKPGDIYIYKKSETASSLESSGYVYVKKDDGGQWEALAGAVSAENVWFNGGVQRTETWGAQTTKNATPQTECEGLNLKQLMEFYLVKQVFPSNVVAADGTYTSGSFSVKDGGATITVTKTSDGSDVAVADYELVNTPVKVKGTYTGDLTKSGATAPTLTAHKITGMTYGYQKYDITDTSYAKVVGTSTDTYIVGTYPTIKYKYDADFTLGKRTSTLQKTAGDTTTNLTESAATKTYESSDSTSTLETSGTSSITVGTNTFKVTNTNLNQWNRAITNDAGSVTYSVTDSITIPKLSNRVKYFDNKKSETRAVSNPNHVYENFSIALTDQKDTRAAKPSVSSASKVVTGYYPVYVGNVDGIPLNNVSSQWNTVAISDLTAKTGQDGFLGKNVTYTLNLGTDNGSSQTSIFVIAPSVVSSVTFQFDGITKAEISSVYTKTIINDGNGKKLDYKIYYQKSTEDAWACKNNVYNFYVTLNA